MSKYMPINKYIVSFLYVKILFNLKKKVEMLIINLKINLYESIIQYFSVEKRSYPKLLKDLKMKYYVNIRFKFIKTYDWNFFARYK